jgi:1,4-dihydroxy-2-naphthoate octaprenyltransferase
MKSVITCDMEGIIETFNKGAEEIFGYDKEELIGKKRVSLFSPGEIVLQNVPVWLKKASEEGEYVTETVFVRKDGTRFPARIRITPTFAKGKDKEQTGYCGVTEILDKDIAEVRPEIRWTTRLIKALVITRMPFVSAVIMPALIGAAYAATYVIPDTAAVAYFHWLHFAAALIGVALLHLGSNVINDYFDVRDGTDPLNTEYFQQYSGGSRAIELGLITLERTKRLGIALLIAATLVGVYLTVATGLPTLIIGLAGLALGYFYTAPPVRLVARRGLGELGIALAFGPLVTLGMTYVLTQQLAWTAFVAGLPAGLLTANILLINEFPDALSDAKTGKNHLVVAYGKKKSVYIYAAILAASMLSNLWLVALLPDHNFLVLIVALLSFAAGLFIINHIRRYYKSRELVKSNVNTIALSALTGLFTAVALLLGGGI